MMRTFRIGIIGFGGFGKFLHHHWNRLENVDIAAVADSQPEKLQGPGPEKAFADWRLILREKEIDLVAIATVPHTHEVIATACMEAGKHVLIEKPLAVGLDGARRIIQVRDKTKAVAGIDFIMRFNPMLQALQSLGRQGIFGQLRRADVENYAQDEQLPPEHWFWNTGQSGGILVEHAVHFIDLVHFLSPARAIAVNGLKHNRNARQEDQVMANVLYEGGLLATHYHSFARPGFFESTRIKLAYDLADIELHGWIPLRAEVKALVNPSSKKTLLNNSLFRLSEIIPVERMPDESRPAGWGGASGKPNRQAIQSGGIRYEVSEMIAGRFSLQGGKEEVYASCVQASLLDVLRKIENPGHALAAPLEAGLESLEIAIRATESAREHFGGK